MYPYRSLLTTLMCLAAFRHASKTYGHPQEHGSAIISQELATRQAPQDANPAVRESAAADQDIVVPDRESRRAVDPLITSPEEWSSQNQQRFDEMERKTSREPIDEPWALKASTLLREAFEEVLRNAEPGSTVPALVSTICRTTVCRLEIAHTADEGDGDFIGDLSSRLGWDGAVLIHRPSNLTTTLYLTRRQRSPAIPK